MENLKETFKKFNIPLTDFQEKQFDMFFENLVETNKVMNLTSIVEPQEVLIKHFLDSSLSQDMLDKNIKVADIGTGAGFPAIPLKIVRPDLDFVLVDSLQKRINFLNDVIKKLNLQNISATHMRAEDFAKQNFEKFDAVVSRAVASLPTLLEYLLPLLKIGGKAFVYKSQKLDEELKQSTNALNILGGKVLEIKQFFIGDEKLERNILVIEKIKRCPTKYPRDKNAPKLKPL